MNVIHLVSNGEWGGGERYVLDICKALRDHGHSVAVVTRGRKAVDSRFRAEGFEPGRLPLGGLMDFISPTTLARVLNRLEGPVVLHVHNFKDADTALRARRLCRDGERVRVVMTRHLVKPAKRGRYHAAIYRGLDALVFVSQAACDAFMATAPALDPSRVHVLHNSIVPPESVTPMLKAEGEIHIAYVGRIAREKGVDVLVKAFAQLCDIEGARLCIAGTGPASEVMPLMELSRRLDVADRVEWLGALDDVYPFVASADIGVVPTRAVEALGLVVLEFMSQSRVVVASGCGGPAELIADGETGLLVPPDDADALAAALRSLVTDSALRERMGAAARARFEGECGYDRFYGRLTRIYNGDE